MVEAIKGTSKRIWSLKGRTYHFNRWCSNHFMEGMALKDVAMKDESWELLGLWLLLRNYY